MAKIQKYKVKSGYRWRVRWVDEDGKQKSKSFDRQKLAADFLVSLEHSMREGTYIAPSDIPLSAYLDDWLEGYKVNLAPNTYRGYKTNINHVKTVIHCPSIQRLQPVDIEKGYSELLQTLSPKSVLYVHRTLSRALKYAEKQRIINRNPCAFVEPPRQDKESKAKVVQQNDITKYLAAFEETPLYPAVCLGMFCGMRRGEVLGLQWQDIDWYNKIINVKNNMTYDGLSTPKSGESRTLPMTEPVMDVLKAQKTKQAEYKAMLWNKYHRSDFVITHEDGRLINPRYFSKCYKIGLQRAKLPFVRFHDLRHTAATMLIKAGVDLKTVSEILGHSSIKITADLYGHIEVEHKREALNKISIHLKG